MLKTTEDRYQGITIDTASLPESTEAFADALQQLIRSIQEIKLIWIKLPEEKSEYIPVLTKAGFDFHHCNSAGLMLVKRIVPGAIIPNPMHYTVGVGAVVLDGKQLLVIRDRFSEGYKFPGGHIDHGETIQEALVREVKEETGVSVVFESIANLGHFTQSQFGGSNIYIVCTAEPLSKDICVQDESEIMEARWIDTDEFLSLQSTNNYNRQVLEAVLSGEASQLTVREVELRVAKGEVFY